MNVGWSKGAGRTPSFYFHRNILVNAQQIDSLWNGPYPKKASTTSLGAFMVVLATKWNTMASSKALYNSPLDIH